MSPSPASTRTRFPSTSRLADLFAGERSLTPAAAGGAAAARATGERVMETCKCPQSSSRQTETPALVALRGVLYTASPMRSGQPPNMFILDEFGYYAAGPGALPAGIPDPRVLEAARGQEAVLGQSGGKARPRKRV